MKKQIAINCSPEEVRVALLEGKTLAELYIERHRDRGTVGNVYKGRVQRVLPGMQAAFVDVGFEKSVFLPGSDIVPSADELATREGAEVAELVGAEAEPASSKRRRRRSPRTPIEDHVKKGQEILVQISKDPMGSKGARATTDVSLAGRYLVYMPTTNHIGVSRRIEDEEERQRLRELVVELRSDPSTGFIVRTVCEGLSRKEIEADVVFLTRTWARIQQRAETASPPALLHSDVDLVQRTVRDFFTPEVGRIVVDSSEEYERLEELIDALAPRLRGRLHLWNESIPPFEKLGLEEQIDRALEPTVRLRSGGSLVIEQTEALISIDVNTGRYVGKSSHGETIVRTNLEAVNEIVRQLRLRNLGGLIVLDFIDMDSEENRTKVFEALLEALRDRDKAQSKILRISELGLVEMTRKRTRESLQQLLCAPCSHCEGVGRTKSAETVAFEIIRRLRSKSEADVQLVRASSAVAARLAQWRSTVNEAKEFPASVPVEEDATFDDSSYEIRSTPSSTASVNA